MTPQEFNVSPLPDPSLTANQMVARYGIKEAHKIATYNGQRDVWKSDALICFWDTVSKILFVMLPPKKPRAKRATAQG